MLATTTQTDNAEGTEKMQTETQNKPQSAGTAHPLSPGTGTDTATDSGFVTATDGFTTAADAGWTSGFGTEFEDPLSSSPLGQCLDVSMLFSVIFDLLLAVAVLNLIFMFGTGDGSIFN